MMVCPFCGFHGAAIQIHHNGRDAFAIECQNKDCQARGPLVGETNLRSDTSQARQKWEERIYGDAQQQ